MLARGRLQVVAQRHEVDRWVKDIVSRGGTLVARSECEPGSDDLDAFGDHMPERLSIAEMAADTPLLESRLDALLLRLVDDHVVVVDLTRSRPQIRCMPAMGGGRVVIKERSKGIGPGALLVEHRSVAAGLAALTLAGER